MLLFFNLNWIGRKWPAAGHTDTMRSLNLTLLTDLYEITMMQGYFKSQNQDVVVFDAFYRENPCGGGYAIACGLDQVI